MSLSVTIYMFSFILSVVGVNVQAKITASKKAYRISTKMQPKDIQLSVGLYIFSLLTQFGASQSNCNYYQVLEPEKSYYVYNPEYPANYSGKNTCVWRAVSQSPIQLNCNIEIPPSPNCSKDHLSIEFDDKSKKDKNCGFGTFALDGNNVTIRFDSLKSTLGGRFRCSLRSEAKCICGWRKVPRIVGGIETGINKYPSMAGLIDPQLNVLYCGATIISSEFVITAAHCVKEHRNVSTIGVVIGEHDVTIVSETSSTKVYRISKCTLHPGYKDGTNDNVAICKIFGTITFSAEVGPVCLPFQHKNDNFADATVTVLGWGLMEFGGPTSTVLRETNLKVVPLKQCRQYYSNVNKSNLCTFAPGKGTCQDSGGPILWRNPVTGRLVLIGIISNGIGCASESPEVAVRTGDYIDWIESVTPGVKYCKVE